MVLAQQHLGMIEYRPGRRTVGDEVVRRVAGVDLGHPWLIQLLLDLLPLLGGQFGWLGAGRRPVSLEVGQVAGRMGVRLEAGDTRFGGAEHLGRRSPVLAPIREGAVDDGGQAHDDHYRQADGPRIHQFSLP